MQINNLPSSSTLAATDVLAKDTSGGTTQKITGQDLANSVKSLSGAASSNQLADAYSPSATYAVGELCIYNNTLYKCTTAIDTAEAWNADHWTATTISEVMVKQSDVVNNLNSTSTNPISSKAVYDGLHAVIDVEARIEICISGNNGYKITFPSGKSSAVWFFTQYGHAFYVAIGGNDSVPSYKNVGITNITPTVNGRTISIPTGGYNRGCFIVCAGNPVTDITIEGY